MSYFIKRKEIEADSVFYINILQKSNGYKLLYRSQFSVKNRHSSILIQSRLRSSPSSSAVVEKPKKCRERPLYDRNRGAREIVHHSAPLAGWFLRDDVTWKSDSISSGIPKSEFSDSVFPSFRVSECQLHVSIVSIKTIIIIPSSHISSFPPVFE